MSGHSATTMELLRKLEAVHATLSGSYVGRDEAVRALLLSAVCQEHLLLIGPPGTAKSDLITRLAHMVTARRFTHLLTRFTEPAELFGPLDIGAFADQKRYRVHTAGMLPTAEIVFLDEVFHASSAILNTLHTLLNERMFHNGADDEPAPLVTLVGAANAMPDDPALRPFADRFLLRVLVEPVAGDQLNALVEVGMDGQFGGHNTDPAEPALTVEDLSHLTLSMRDVRLGGVRPVYEQVVADLLALGVTLSDRRIVRGLKAVAGAALLRGDDRARPRDLWPLYHFWTDPSDRDTVQKRVEQVVRDDGGDALFIPRPAHDLLTEAQCVVDGLDRSDPGDLALGAALTRLNHLRKTLRRDHPDCEPELRGVTALIEDVLHRLNNHNT